jgi:DNA-directed RNA polymerase specialized sigma24 family protein
VAPWRRAERAIGADDTASDAVLVVRARSDPDAFGRLYARHRDRLVRYCYYRLHDWADAEDAAHEAFAKAFVRLAGFDDRGDAFSPWLFRIAHNEVVDRHRRRAAHAELPLAAAAQFMNPYGLALDGQGNVYVADYLTPNSGRLQAFRILSVPVPEVIPDL